MHNLIRLGAFGTALAASAVCFAQGSGNFEHVASYRALGGLVATAIAPGPTPESQRVYASYLYNDITFDVIAIDPRDGSAQVFHDPIPGEFGARNLAVAPNGDVYFGTLPHAQPKGNPSFANFDGSDEHWRPQVMIEGPDGLIYIGGTESYGQLEGPIVVWDGATEQATAYGNLIRNQSVVSLAVWRRQIVAGTTTEGGGGSHPTEKDACVFFWDAASHKLLWKVVPVPGASLVTDLIASRSGVVYGVAVDNTTNTLFAIDPKRHEVLSTQVLLFDSVPYNGIVADSHGAIWGLGDIGIFRIEDNTHRAVLAAKSPVPATADLALRGHDLYFVSNSEVYRYTGVTDAAK